jgi:uncharacterized membrane protein SirB2
LALVVLSGTLFALRGAGVLAGARWPLHKALRIGSVVIDTLLLSAGVTLWALLPLNPLREQWLGAKLALLVLYIFLGSWALKRAGTTAARAAFLIAALTVFATMVSIGWTRHPLGMWRWF